jgi:polyisoprenoid-binding protein YceI
MTVRGTLGLMAGQAAVSPDGAVTGRVSIDVRSLDTGHKKRDEHLRSADFFHADEHPRAILTVTSARPAGPDALECQGTLDLAGHARPVSYTARIQNATGEAVELTVDLQVDRTEFGMTWNPLRMTSATALGTVKARFTRA